MVLRRRQFLGLCGLLGAAACTRPARLFRYDILAWGQHGLRDGEFLFPRAIAVRDNEVYVGDKSGRIQVFTLEGVFLRKWATPSNENGTPTGMAFPNADEVVVPDTHYSRVLTYDRQGTLMRQWGEYGSGENQFIYPTDVAIANDGTLYFSEYGMDADRIHVFDQEGRFVRLWGRFGEAPGEFNRAMSLDFAPDGSLLVADTANHRVQRFDVEGKLLGIIGSPGREHGQLNFPHYLTCLSDDTFLVCEYGNNRVSRLTLDGHVVGSYGWPGRATGEFAAPRGVAANESWFFVADTDNHRVQRIEIKALT